jgi:hypothetical protein
MFQYPSRPRPLRRLIGPAAALGLLGFLGLAAAARAQVSWPDGVEPPPARYASGPTQYGDTHERRFAQARDLQAFCDFYLGRPAAGAYQACYVPALDLVVLPAAAAQPDPRVRAELRAHEWAHARGWRHPVLTTASAAGR